MGFCSGIVPPLNGPEEKMAYFRDSNLPTKQIALVIETSTYELLRAEAYKQRMSMVGLIRNIVRFYLDVADPAVPAPPPTPAEQFSAPRPAPDWKEIRQKVENESANQHPKLNPQAPESELNIIRGNPPLEEQGDLKAVGQIRYGERSTSISNPSSLDVLFKQAQAVNLPKPPPVPRPPHKRSDVI